VGLSSILLFHSAAITFYVSAFVFSKISKVALKMVSLVCIPSELRTVLSCSVLWQSLHQIEMNCS
jgi:hypothetical protein